MVYFLLVVTPAALMIYYSFTAWDGATLFPTFTGLENYRDVFEQPAAVNAAIVTIKFTLLAGAITNIVGLGAALLVNRPDRMSLFYRLVIFSPIVLSSVIVGFLWRAIFNYNGLFNSLVSALGHEPLSLLGDPQRALWLIVGAAVWNTGGFAMMIYLAGLQGISSEVLEASEVDGAGRLAQARYIILPLLAPVITINIVLALIAGLKQYDLVRVITNGGPARATETVALKIITDGLALGNYGTALALAVLLMAATALLTALTLWLRRGGQ